MKQKKGEGEGRRGGEKSRGRKKKSEHTRKG